jgi:methylthioribulose-1-phosphate dehydratase
MNNDRTSYKSLFPQRDMDQVNLNKNNFSKLVADLVEVGKNFYLRGWVLGTSGNFSAVISMNPLRLAITSTGLDKGGLTSAHFVEIDSDANVIHGEGRPSAEALLHLTIVRCVNARAVLHTHSVWSTVLSSTHASFGGFKLEGYEMLKGLDGVRTHQHHEWLPILENSQNMIELSDQVSTLLRENSKIHGFLLLKHGFYTWGNSLQEAKYNVEILEFLMEVLVRSAGQTKDFPEQYQTRRS